jgi:putrescine transport system permease protein
VSAGGALLRRLALCAGFAFLYGPIAVLAVMSFNASRLVTVWGGFSTKWYASLLENEALMKSAWISFEAAAVSATLATVLGLCAAVALARFGSFPTRSLFFSAVYAPLVLPEVVLGLALLSAFVAFGLNRGFFTLVVAHTTFTMCFTTVVLLAALRTVEPAQEEAAMDLGATPAQAFALVVLPAIAPSLASAFLMAFTLSLDDLVIASFATGPGATTLPMRIYSQVRLGVTPEVNAVSTLLLGFVGMILALSALLGRRPHASI